MRYLFSLALSMLLTSIAAAQCHCGNPGCRCNSTPVPASANFQSYNRPAIRYILIQDQYGGFQLQGFPSVRQYDTPPAFAGLQASVNLPRLQASVSS